MVDEKADVCRPSAEFYADADERFDDDVLHGVYAVFADRWSDADRDGKVAHRPRGTEGDIALSRPEEYGVCEAFNEVLPHGRKQLIPPMASSLCEERRARFS